MIMSRELKIKELRNTRLAKTYGGWIYCEGCGQAIGYLCFTTYDCFCLDYQCKCGGKGSIRLEFKDINASIENKNPLIEMKNRWCCPSDHSPLFSVVPKRLDQCNYEVVCCTCNSKYKEEMKL